MVASYKLPKNKTAEKSIPLDKYGGEGEIYIRGLQLKDSIDTNNYVMGLSMRDGFTVTTEAELKSAMERYKFETLFYLIERCAYVIEDDGSKRFLSKDEIVELPIELINDIMSAIEETGKFPLAQTAGKGQK